MEKNNYTIIFDDQCPLCLRFKQGLSHILSNEFQFRSILEETNHRDFPQLDIDQLKETVHMISNTGDVFKGVELIEVIAKHTPLVSKFAWLLETGGGKKASEFFYDKVNQLKEQLKESCPSCDKK